MKKTDKAANQALAELLVEIRACQHCVEHLPLGARPVLAAGKSAKVLVMGQAPGIRVHNSGVAWDDPSGRRLREWMGIDESIFYDENKVAIVPMGFCFPGTGKSGDLPPRRECAPLWHDQILQHLDSIEVTLLLGQYSQKAILGKRNKRTLTETVASWKVFQPEIFPMPHPSPRNNRWLAKNPSFEKELLPALKRRLNKVLGF